MAVTFYIESLTAKGEGKRDSKVTFGPNLNILVGTSDTGKTMILDCIAYVFGKDKKSRLSKDIHGYDTMTVSIRSSLGYKTEITRISEGKDASIVSEDPHVVNGIYPYKTAKEETTVSDVLFSLMGIQDVPKLASDSTSKKAKMTWRNFIRTIYLDKDKLTADSNLIVPDDSNQKTLFLSILLFMIYGKDFSSEPLVKKEITQAQYQATFAYIQKSVKNLEVMSERLGNKLKNYYGPNLPSSIDSYTEALENIESQINDCINESNDLYEQACEATKNLNERKVSRDSYANLEKQYLADIERLSSMTQGGRLLASVSHLDSCPFCHNEISPEFKEMNIEGAKAELTKTMKLYNGLLLTEKAIVEQIDKIEREIQDLNYKKQRIERKVVDELKPMASNLRNGIALYEEYTELKAKENLCQEIIADINCNQQNLETDYKEKMKEYKNRRYAPLNHFDDVFEDKMSETVSSILFHCGYPEYYLAKFDKRSFNFNFSYTEKEARHGQGICTFLNSVLYLALSTYMADNAIYKPSFLMLDTPLLGLSEANTKENIHENFFNKCVPELGKKFQLLITAHPADIPVSFDKTKCNVIEFNTKGHKGFLLDYVPKASETVE